MSAKWLKKSKWQKRLEEVILFRTGNYFFRYSRRFFSYDLVDLEEHVGGDSQFDSSARYGILLQGPVIPRLTKSISAYYERIYPDIPIVISTWADSDFADFAKSSSKNLKFVLSDLPSNPGPSNVNLQIISTRKGIEALKLQNCTHILKSRTDILLQSPTFISYLHFMLNKGYDNSIVFSSFNSFLFRLFSPSDQIQFGLVKNIEAFWDVELVARGTEFDFPEKYLFQNYIKRFGWHLDDTLDGYWKALSEFTVIADHEQLGQIWNKGAYTSLVFRWRSKIFPNSMTQLSAWKWEAIRENPAYLKGIKAKLK